MNLEKTPLTKRPATPEEIEAAIQYVEANKNAFGDYDIRKLHEQAVKEGYIAEVCSCEKFLLAHHHYVRCDVEECPMKSKTDKRTLAQDLLGLD